MNQCGRAGPSRVGLGKLAGTLKSVRLTCKTSISDEKYIITGDQKYNKHGRKKRLLSIVFAGANVAKGRQLLEKNKHTQRQRVRKCLIYDRLNYSILCMLRQYGFNFSNLWNTHTRSFLALKNWHTQNDSVE